MNNLNELIFENYIENKKIIIVGPAKYLIGKKMGKFIDNFDIVIRIKKGFPIKEELKEDLGEKTDILLSSLKTSRVKDINRKYYYQNNFKKEDIEKMNKLLNFILFPYPTIISPFDKFYSQFKLLNNVNTILITGNNKYDNYLKFIKELDTTPTIFLVSLWYLLFFKFKELYIIGITFQEDGYYNEYKSYDMFKSSQKRTINGKIKVHDMNKEKQYLKKIINKDNRIIFDNYILI